jgi:hypothetical protein
MPPTPQPAPKPHWLARTATILATLTILFVLAAEYVLHHAGPIVRTRVVETLAARFHAPVELDDLQISLFRGIEVEGTGLRILTHTSQPLLTVQHFSFRTTAEGLLHEPTHLAIVRVDGMVLHIPTSANRPTFFASPDPQHPNPKIAFTAAEILATRTTIILDTTNPARRPLTFSISRLDLHNIGPAQPLAYDAQLINPRPTGAIHATGHFGPWNAADPRRTPIDGVYTFDHADLSTIQGLGGTLSSIGRFTGLLDHLIVDGTTDTPNFWLDLGNHPLPLHTAFHALVNGTTGDTTLDPVQGLLNHSPILARGSIVNLRGLGHDISLDITLSHAPIEDLLTLAVKTSPPLMRGDLDLRGHLHIPPGRVRVAEKMQISGTTQIQNVVFERHAWQRRLDGLSQRAQGKPEDARSAEIGEIPNVNSQMSLNFRTGHGAIFVDNLDYKIPGAEIFMNGVYSTDGRVFEFAGHVRTQAKASQMVTGWKSLLLMPFDHMLARNGAGLELPVSISGTAGDIHFGLAAGGLSMDNSQQIAAQMATQMKSKPKNTKPANNR